MQVRDVKGRIIGKAKVGNYYPGTNKYQISFLYPTGESEAIDVPGWCLVVEEKKIPVQYSTSLPIDLNTNEFLCS